MRTSPTFLKGVICILKAVGQSIKAWILTHKKLYFFIIGFIAFVSFMVITLIGFGKISKAATEVTYITRDGTETATVYDIRELSWDYWLENTQDAILARYDNPENLANDIIKECNYMVVVGGSHYYFFIEPFYHDTSLAGQQNIYLNYDNGYKVEVGVIDGVPSVVSVVGMYDNASNTDSVWNVMYNNGSNIVGSTYDFLVNCEDSLKTNVTRNNLTYPVIESYSVEAPYFTFSNLYLYNPILSGDTGILGSGSAFSDFWEAFTKNSLWRYRGQLQKVDLQKDDSYALSLNITIELPTWEYLEEQYMSFGVDLNDAWEHSILKYAPEVYQKWINDSKAPTHTFVITDYQYPTLDANNIFSFQYTFEELLAYIRYFNDDAKTLFSGYDNNALGLHLAFMHFDIMVGNVRTTQGKELVYGRPTTNDFDRGIYGVCLEVTPEVDINTMTPEEMDKVLEDAFKEAHDKYVSDLESEVGRLDEEIQNIQSIGGAFDNLGASDVWSGFVSVVKGFASMGPAIGQLSVLVGSVFAFFPIQVAGFMSFTMLTICIVAIIKAIRG